MAELLYHDNFIRSNWEILNQNNKIVSHMAFQAASLIGSTEPSNYVPGSSDGHAQLLTAGNF